MQNYQKVIETQLTFGSRNRKMDIWKFSYIRVVVMGVLYKEERGKEVDGKEGAC